jgi:hypothetical protein
MNKNKWFLVLIAISAIALIGSATACAPTAPAGPAAKPTINSFTASPTSISTGQETTLSWNVSGATDITIEPGIGTAGSIGSMQLSPDAGTTYTITATNKAGSATASVAVAVTPAVPSKPDLVVTDCWLITDTIYFKVKNQGNADSNPTWLRLYINDFEQDTKYVDILAPWQEETSNFSGYEYEQYLGGSTTEGYEILPVYVKICVDEDNAVAESDEANNCISQVWGITETYDFRYNAYMAKWRSSAGDLNWGGLPSDNKGAAFIYLDELTICPEKVSNGWILGRFADFYLTEETNVPSSRQMVVPKNAKFIAELGFRRGHDSTDGVRVGLGYLDETFSLVMFPKMDVYNDGEWHTYEVDLSGLAGKKTEFFLWVEAKDSPEGDCVTWMDPRIIQE